VLAYIILLVVLLFFWRAGKIAPAGPYRDQVRQAALDELVHALLDVTEELDNDKSNNNESAWKADVDVGSSVDDAAANAATAAATGGAGGVGSKLEKRALLKQLVREIQQENIPVKLHVREEAIRRSKSTPSNYMSASSGQQQIHPL